MQSLSDIRRMFTDMIHQAAPLAAEVRMVEEQSRLLRFADSRVAQHVAEHDRKVTLRLADAEGRVGVAVCNQLQPAALGRALEAARAIVNVVPPDADWPGFPTPDAAQAALAPAYGEATAEATPAEVGDLVARAIADAGRGTTLSGSLLTVLIDELVTNSEGLTIDQRRTRADFRVTARPRKGVPPCRSASGLTRLSLSGMRAMPPSASPLASTQRALSNGASSCCAPVSSSAWCMTGARRNARGPPLLAMPCHLATAMARSA